MNFSEPPFFKRVSPTLQGGYGVEASSPSEDLHTLSFSIDAR